MSQRLNFFRLALVVAIVCLPTPALSQDTPSSDTLSTQQANSQRQAGEAVPLIFWNRRITVFRSYYEQTSPAERARRAAERLANLPEFGPNPQIVATETTSGQYTGSLITVDGNLAFGILTTDLDREAGETLKSAADQATAQLRAALEARTLQKSWSVLVKGIALSVVATIIALLGLWLLMRSSNAVLRSMDQRHSANTNPIKVGGFDLRPPLHRINRGLTKLTTWAITVVLLYAWLIFVLLRFPYSQPWGLQLGSFLINLLQMLGRGLLRAAPGMFTVLVIFLLARIVARLVNALFYAVETESINLSWLHADTARATRRLVVALIWVFAITVAYPYVPGSSSDAFKGVSVFVGLMVSLGSAGLLNQVMSGLVVVYSRALRQGEFVKIGDDVGVVTEVGLLSTKLITRKREEITIPNAVLVGTRSVNYSRHAGDGGAIVSTTVTIGYDAPWRLVHAMLLKAADQTAGVRKDPAPRVWQKSLSDFYVEYDLVVNLDRPEERIPVLSEMHTHIQDAFNEQGVQIMSPHFETQPNNKVFVPKSEWFTKLAEGAAQDNGKEPGESASMTSTK
jgi:small-conductance mechanosensitive channel